MGGGVQTGEDPVRVNQTHDKGHAVGLPASGVDEVTEDVACTCVRASASWDSDQDDQERNQRDPKSALGNEREDLSNAVEQEAEKVDQLVCENNVPGLDDTNGQSAHNTTVQEHLNAYKSGWPSCHMPTAA
jgi:hypothetical protein